MFLKHYTMSPANIYTHIFRLTGMCIGMYTQLIAYSKTLGIHPEPVGPHYDSIYSTL